MGRAHSLLAAHRLQCPRRQGPQTKPALIASRLRTAKPGAPAAVGKYLLRPVLALERLTFLEPEGKVGYRWGRDGAGQETMDYLEFIARVTAHIPDKGQVMVRYYGLNANAPFIDHLRLTFVAAKPPPSHLFEQVAFRAAEESGEDS